MTLDLKHVRYFLAVAEERHITRAAEKLGMQQPPLSQCIKEMERQLDVQLFRRKARGVELTDAGRVFLNTARTMLADYECAVQSTRRAARGELGELSVGIMPTAFRLRSATSAKTSLTCLSRSTSVFAPKRSSASRTNGWM
jgi:DNA-binding transcriptional LysR family regulator